MLRYDKEYEKKKRRKILSRFSENLRRYFIFLVVLAVAIAGAIATYRIYNDSKNENEENTNTAIDLEAADNYKLIMYEPNSFDALASSDQDVVYLNQIIYSFLFRIGDNMNIVPDVVMEYKVNAEEGYVDLTLNTDVYYSNGVNLDAADVQNTIARINEIGASSPYFAYTSKIKETYIYGTYGIIVYFHDPADAALDNLVFPIVSTSGYEIGQSFTPGSGPYSYGEYNTGKSLTLVPNEYYSGICSNYPIEIMMTGDKASVPGLISMDAVTAYISSEQGIDAIAEDKDLNCKKVISGELEYLGFNCDNELLQEKDFRRAIASAINRDKIIEDDYGSNAVASDSLYYPGFLGSDPKDTIVFDPKYATDLLLGLDLRDVDEDGLLETSNGDDVIINLIVRSDITSRVGAARSIAEQLMAIGIGVEVIPMTNSEMKAALGNKNFDLFLTGIQIDKQFDLRNLYRNNNYGNFKGDMVIGLTYELERAHSDEELVDIFRNLKSALWDEMPYFGICYKYTYFISVATLETGQTPQYFNPYRNIQNWIWQKRVKK